VHYSKRQPHPDTGGNTIVDAVRGMLHGNGYKGAISAAAGVPNAAVEPPPAPAAAVQSVKSKKQASSPWASLRRWAGARSSAQKVLVQTANAPDRAALLKAQGRLAAGVFADSAARVRSGKRCGLRWEEEVGVAGSVTETDATHDTRWMLLPHEAAAALRAHEDLSWAEAHRRLASTGGHVAPREKS
jgi:hypothetical protein